MYFFRLFTMMTGLEPRKGAGETGFPCIEKQTGDNASENYFGGDSE